MSETSNTDTRASLSWYLKSCLVIYSRIIGCRIIGPDVRKLKAGKPVALLTPSVDRPRETPPVADMATLVNQGLFSTPETKANLSYQRCAWDRPPVTVPKPSEGPGSTYRLSDVDYNKRHYPLLRGMSLDASRFTFFRRVIPVL